MVAMAFQSHKRSLEGVDKDVDKHHGDDFGVYMRHKRQRLHLQFQDAVYV